MPLFAVSMIVPEEDDQYRTDSPELVPVTYLFDDENEARQFCQHVRDLYELPVSMASKPIDTYDSAIQWLVEWLGPSKED